MEISCLSSPVGNLGTISFIDNSIKYFCDISCSEELTYYREFSLIHSHDLVANILARVFMAFILSKSYL